MKYLGAAIVSGMVFAAVSPISAGEPKAATLPENETRAFETTCRALAESFRKDDTNALRELCIPKALLSEVISPKLLERGVDELYKKILEGNTLRFAEWRKKFQDLSAFEFTSAEPGYRLERAEAYADPKLILKNSHFTIAHRNRIVVKIKIEEMVFIAGKCYVMKLD